jgi:major outer membrane protein
MLKYLFFFALFLSGSLFGAPVGNTSAPQILEDGFFISRNSWVDVRAGYEGDFVTNGRMEQQDSGRIDCYKQYTNSGTVTLNLLDRIDLYGVFGSSSTNADWRFTDLENSVHRIEIQTDRNFLWAAGGRAIFFEWGCACLGLGGRYSWAKYDPEWVTNDGANAPSGNGEVRWNQWQINLDISYKIELFTPYIGAKYSSAQTILNGFPIPISSSGSGSNTFKNTTPVGLYLGCTLSTGRYFMLNLEARLIDEEAITVSGDFRF